MRPAFPLGLRPDQLAQLLGGELTEGLLSAGHDPLRQIALGANQGINALLHRAAAHQLMRMHRTDLTDSMGPIGGLVLHRRVPPTVVMDHMGGGARG